MLELLVLILLILLLFGGWRWRATGALVGDALGVIVLIFFIVIVISLLTPWPYHHAWYYY